jgi:hypothetical protein
METDREALREWHRLFGLLLTDFFTGSPFVVEVERDLSRQQQFLDVVIVRRGRGRMTVRLPDGLEDLAAHNLISFKSHREALDPWAMKELIGHSVAYRKLVSPSPSDLLAEDQFRLFAICARLPHNLAGQVPWQQRQPGVYDCRRGTDAVRVIVAGQLPREAHNAPLHLFSASPDLVGFGGSAYQRRSDNTSGVLGQLFGKFRREGFAMTYTMADFQRDFIKEHFPELPPEQQREVLQSLPAKARRECLRAMAREDLRAFLRTLPRAELREVLASVPREGLRDALHSLPPEERLAGLSAEQIRQYLDDLTAGRRSPPKPRRRK